MNMNRIVLDMDKGQRFSVGYENVRSYIDICIIDTMLGQNKQQ